MGLFSDRVRIDGTPAGYAESSFEFLDRVNQPYWHRIREELDRWFEAYPPGEPSRDLRERFRKRKEGQHLAAWWELYLHRLFTGMGFSVEVHPELSGTGAHPDFRVTGPSGSFLVEAATTFSGLDDDREHSPLEARILDLINGLRSDCFTVGVEFESIGTTMPRSRDVKAIERWLSTLDPDAYDDMSASPQETFHIGDWAIDITAFPVRREHRGEPGRLIGFGPVMVGAVNDVKKLCATLDRKHRKYGALAEPFLFAVLMPSTFADNTTVEKALFGSTGLQYEIGRRGNEKWIRRRDGFWMRPTGPRATWVSGVITGFGITPGELAATRWPRLWPNPWAAVPLVADLPLPLSVGSEEAAFDHAEPPDSRPGDLLGLDADWPGPDPPFLFDRAVDTSSC